MCPGGCGERMMGTVGIIYIFFRLGLCCRNSPPRRWRRRYWSQQTGLARHLSTSHWLPIANCGYPTAPSGGFVLGRELRTAQLQQHVGHPTAFSAPEHPLTGSGVFYSELRPSYQGTRMDTYPHSWLGPRTSRENRMFEISGDTGT